MIHKHSVANSLINQVPEPWRSGIWFPLLEGLTNQTFRVQVSSQNFFVRLRNRHTDVPGQSVMTELNILPVLSRARVYPVIHYLSVDGDVLITDWCAGHHWSLLQWQSSAGIRQLGAVTARIHHLKLRSADVLNLSNYLGQLWCQWLERNEQPNDLLSLADHLQEPKAGEYECRFFAALPPWISQTRQALQQLSPLPLVPSHCDLHPGNVLGKKPWILDWEFFHLTDPAFDLATIALYGRYTTAQQVLLLENYRGHGGIDMDISRLNCYRKGLSLLCWLWADIMRMNANSATELGQTGQDESSYQQACDEYAQWLVEEMGTV